MTAYPIPLDARTKCADDPDLMFASRRDSPARLEQAKRVCQGCPYTQGCLMWGLTRGEQGVWAGTDEEDRKEYRKAHGIKVVRPQLSDLPRGNSRVIPHGTPVGVEHHRRKYEPLCEPCEEFDEARAASRAS